MPKLLEPLLTTTTLIPTTTTLRSTTASTITSTTENLLDYTSTIQSDDTTFYDLVTEEGIISRTRRSIDDMTSVLKPGVCLKGCNIAFWTFSIASMIVNWFGSSGRIGNLLVNYRSVSTEDKSFAQGLSLMMVSLLALIPGPIIFGRIIDSTCLKWTKTCSGNGNCQIYDQSAFRYLVNTVAFCKFKK